MGQAKIRKQKLGALYGTPEGLNQPSRLIIYPGLKQKELDKKGIQQILAALKTGCSVVLTGTSAARPIAKATGLKWLHELSADEVIPDSVAWDLEVASNGGPMLPAGYISNKFLVLGAGTAGFIDRYRHELNL
jgi:hypothetical protein